MICLYCIYHVGATLDVRFDSISYSHCALVPRGRRFRACTPVAVYCSHHVETAKPRIRIHAVVRCSGIGQRSNRGNDLAGSRESWWRGEMVEGTVEPVRDVDVAVAVATLCGCSCSCTWYCTWCCGCRVWIVADSTIGVVVVQRLGDIVRKRHLVRLVHVVIRVAETYAPAGSSLRDNDRCGGGGCGDCGAGIVVFSRNGLVLMISSFLLFLVLLFSWLMLKQRWVQVSVGEERCSRGQERHHSMLLLLLLFLL